MKIPSLLIIFITAIFPDVVKADTPASPRPWVTTSEYGDYFFKMVPPKWKKGKGRQVIDREAFGVTYEIQKDGQFKELWRTSGWYAFEGFFSERGRYFVRIGPWASDLKKYTDLAIAFYDQGKLLRKYEVRELIKKPETLERSVSHYEWLPATQSIPNGFYGPAFHLVMIDKTRYSFDLETGEIIDTGKDEKAKSRSEIWRGEGEAAQRNGKELLDASTFKEPFEHHFEFSGVQEMRGSFSSCSLEGETWTADLVPKRELKHKAEICVVFPIRGKAAKRIEVSLTPKEILNAIEQALDHPFVVSRFSKGGATGIRLRTQGDRLHWDTPELIEFIKKSSGKTAEPGKLRHWAYLILDASEPRYTSFYYDTETKEVLIEDRSKWPWEPYLIGADGKRKRTMPEPTKDGLLK